MSTEQHREREGKKGRGDRQTDSLAVKFSMQHAAANETRKTHTAYE